MIEIDQFIKELKIFGVRWSEQEHKHLIGNEVLTNLDMRIMASNRFGSEYDNLSSKEKKNVRESIFRGIK